MARHERDVKMKRITRIFIYFMLVVAMTIVFFLFRRWEKNRSIQQKPATAYNIDNVESRQGALCYDYIPIFSARVAKSL